MTRISAAVTVSALMAAALSLGLAQATEAHAEEYTAQVVAPDLVSVLTLHLAVKAESEAASKWLAVGSLGLFVAGSPAVHVAHGEWDSALYSAGLRAGLALAVGGLGIRRCRDDALEAGAACYAGVLLLALAGLATVATIDYAYLSQHAEPDGSARLIHLSTRF